MANWGSTMTPEKTKVRRRGWVLLSAIAVCFAALRAVTAQPSAFSVDRAMKAIEQISSRTTATRPGIQWR